MNVYQKITDEVVEQLRAGVIPWERPFVNNFKGAINYVSRRPYSLLNTMLLRRSGEYLTFNQIQALGGRVKAGAKAEFVVFFKQVERTEVIDGETVEKGFPLLRYYNVFHIDDVEGIESRLDSEPLPEVASNVSCVDEALNGYLGREGISVEECAEGDPRYLPASDVIRMPGMERFISTEHYYSVLLHEMIHSTGKSGRLDRGLEENREGDENYSREELVAEMGSVMAGRELGIGNARTQNNSAAYIQGWIDALGGDPKMVVWAAGRAEKAVKFMLGDGDRTSMQS